MPKLTSATFVLERSPGRVADPCEHVGHGSSKPRVRFTRLPDDHTDVPNVVWIDWDTAVDLDWPEEITVTVQPGDHLNTEGE